MAGGRLSHHLLRVKMKAESQEGSGVDLLDSNSIMIGEGIIFGTVGGLGRSGGVLIVITFWPVEGLGRRLGGFVCEDRW